MIIKRLLVALVGMLMLAGVTTALGSPAQAATTYTHESRIVFAAQAKSVYANAETITVTGQVQVLYQGTWYGNDLTDSDYVTVARQNAGSTTWTNVTTVYPGEAGKFTFTTSSNGTATYRFSYSGNQWGDSSGNTHIAPAVTADRTIKGKRKATGWGSKSDGKIYLNGVVLPNYAYKKVVLQKKACGTCAWKDYDVFQTGKEGKYRHQVFVPRSGKWFWRVRVPATLPRWEQTIAPGIYTYRA